MRHITILIICCSVFQIINAQPYPQIRLKTGGSILFPSPNRNNYGYNYNGAGGSVVIGGEFSKPLKNKSGAWQVGFTFQDGQSNLAPNIKNVIPINTAPSGPGFGIFNNAPAKTTIYGGVEKYLNRSATRLSKNYFSVVGGAGVSFTMNKLNGWEYSFNQQFTTRDGRTINGFSSNYERPRFPVGLSLYSGLRYNITNKNASPIHK